MIQKALLLLLCLSWLHYTHAQVFTNSNLPIVLIKTDNGVPIPDEPGIHGQMKIIDRGPGMRNYVSDQDSIQFLDYNGRIDIEIRGSYSQAFPKKAYGFSTLLADNVTNNNVSLLGMPAENDWILDGLSSDPSLIRDCLAYHLARKTGQYATRTAYCEVVVNGDYRGLYLLAEKIKPDKNRVNIEKIEPTENSLPGLTGGYITKTDKTTGGDPIAWSMSSYSGFNDQNFIHHWPKPEYVTTAQNNYIKSVFLNLLASTTANNASITNGFPSIIDVPSFVDFILVNELASNVDAYTFSTYYHKDRNGKLRAGPVWDENLTFGNDLFQFGVDRSKPDVWQFSNGSNEGPKYVRDLCKNATFKCYLSRRWNELTQPGAPFHLTSLQSYIDSTVANISEATVRENTRWGTVGNQTSNINFLKNWLSLRIPWMTNQLGPFSDCQLVDTPPLVISKIHYHPDTSASFPDENRLEFLELTNAGSSDIDLTGIYFGGTGLSYQFHNGATLPAGTALVLASDSSTYKARYGMPAFGQFTRNLSNSEQKLRLLDAFGNEIDRVHYHDDTPWPDADGNGKFLQLISVDLDNSLASSWKAVGVNTLGANQIAGKIAIQVYPNPSNGPVYLHSMERIEHIVITDLQGREMAHIQVQDQDISLDLTFLPKGLYLMRVALENGIGNVKLIKN